MRACSTRSSGAAAAAAWIALAGAVGCSSPSQSAASSPGGAANEGGDAAVALNPDGVPYPSPPNGYGHTARTGNTPGSIIQNFSFQGYPNADTSNGLQTVSLADYYDPCGRRLKLLHITVGAVWCESCSDETVAIVADQGALASDQVVVLQALGDGATVGVPATMADLENWISKYMSTFTEMLDPGYATFGAFFNTSSVPWNCDVDPRTMEIVHVSNGWAMTVDAELQPSLDLVAAPPGYPIPDVCGDP